jgi:hypothetical protein
MDSVVEKVSGHFSSPAAVWAAWHLHDALIRINKQPETAWPDL